MKKINYLHLSLLLYTLLQAASTNAQTEKTITLKEAIELGVKNSKHLKIDEAKIMEAAAAIDEAKNKQLPDFKVTGAYMRLTNANVNLKTGQQSQSEGSNNTQGSGFPKVNQATYGIANLSIPIYAGGRIKYGIESSKYLLEAVKLSSTDDKNTIVYNITQSYANLFKAFQVINVIKENLAASRSRDSNFLRLENNGLMARNDRLKAQLQTSNIELQLLEAENNYTIANINMDLLLGLPETQVLVIDPGFMNTVFEEKPLLYYEELAQQNRKDVQALVYQQKAATLGTKAARAAQYPTIAFTGGYIGANIPNVLTVYNAVNAGIGIQYNIANLWKTNAVLKQSKARELQLEANRALMADGIKIEINKDYQNAWLAKKKIEVYQKAEEQAIENYRITKNKYDNSLVTVTDLLEADASLLATKINLLNAKADAALSYQKLLQTTGTLSN